MKFLRRLLYIFLRCLPKTSSLFPSNYGGNVLNEVQPCSHREDKNPEKTEPNDQKEKVDFPLSGGCLVDYPGCQKQSFKGFINNNDS